MDGMTGFGQPEGGKDARSSSENPAPADFEVNCEAGDAGSKTLQCQTTCHESRRNSAESVISFASRFQIRKSRSMMPLLSTYLNARTTRISQDRRLGAGILPNERIRNPYQRSFTLMMSAMGITVAMSVYQEIILGFGIAGCTRESISQEECESIRFLFITVPLLFRQV